MPESWPEEMKPHYDAKADADREVEASGLDYTIVRPGSLTDEPPAGRLSGDVPIAEAVRSL